MALPAFDTYAYVKKLQDAGFTEKEAAAQAELQSEILGSLVTDKLATKEDIKDLKNEILLIKKDVEKLASKEDIVRIEGEFKAIRWMGRTLIGIATTILIMIVKLVFFN